jgi:hypothetical protein
MLTSAMRGGRDEIEPRGESVAATEGGDLPGSVRHAAESNVTVIEFPRLEMQ